jgi:branched-chain amino acid transport system substrate-binding protein
VKKALVLLLILLFFSGCENKIENDFGEKVKIGISLPLTGNAAIYGKSMQNGIDLALKKLKNKNNIEILPIQDDMSDGRKSVGSIEKLLTSGADIIIGGAQSKTAKSIIPIIHKKQIPLISPFASGSEFDNMTDYFLRMVSSDSYNISILVKFIESNYSKDTTIATFYTNSAYGVGANAIFEKLIKSAGYKIVSSNAFTEGKNSYRAELMKIKHTSPHILFIPGYYKEIKTILKEMYTINFQPQIVGTSSFNDEKLLKDEQLRGILENIVYVHPNFDINNPSSTTQSFLNTYNSTYSQKGDIFAANSYDAMQLIDRAITIIKKDNISLKEALYKVKNFHGVSGLVKFDKQGNIEKQINIFKIIDRKTKLVD